MADENEQGVISLETDVRGTCTPEHLLDIVENFRVFEEGRGGLLKKVPWDGPSPLQSRPKAGMAKKGLRAP